MIPLKEIADRYNKSPRTFRKYVKAYGIPHQRLGRDLFFDPDEVAKHLKITESPIEKPAVQVKGRRIGARPIQSRFAEALAF